MVFGVDYYPEHWPKERWQTDADLMAQAHMNIVRLAEFSWAKLEPEEGRYDFSWLDRAIAVLAQKQIRVVLGTPSAAPPKWLMDKHPEWYPENAFGIRKGFGGRRHYCYTNAEYRRCAVKMAGKMAARFGKNRQVAAWQIDNEMGGICYCEACRTGFQDWLKKKYHTAAALNEAWGTVFWSQTYSDFTQVEPPRYNACDGFFEGNPAGNAGAGVSCSHNPGLLLDYYRFSSDSKVEFINLQAEEIRSVCAQPVTHNFMGHYGEIDYYRLGGNLDFISWDNYPDFMWGKENWQHTAMAHAITYGIKNRNFWVMEQQSGPCGWQKLGDTPAPGQLRLWTYQAIAHGADAVLYFRWRACLSGTENYWYGVLDHDGIPRRRYREIQNIGEEIGRLSGHLTGGAPAAQTAIVRDFDNLWSHRIQPHNADFDYDKLLSVYDAALRNCHLNVDVVRADCDFSPYALVLMPAFNLVTESIAGQCRRYVRNGGNLLLTFRSGTKEWSNQMTERTLPGLFRELSGITIEEFDSLNFGRKVKVEGGFGEGTASMWCDLLRTETASVEAVYRDGWYEGIPAVTVNRFGKGRVIYVGCDLDDAGTAALIGKAASMCGLKPAIDLGPDGVETAVKEKDGQRYVYLLNHNAFSVTAKLCRSGWELLLDRREEGQLELEPFGVKIVREDKYGE